MTALTARRLLHDSASTALTDTDTTTSWADWGEEVLTFPQPGIEVLVDAVVSGYAVRDDTAQDVAVRVAISTDGGGSFTTGNEPVTTVGNVGGSAVRQNITAHHSRSGTPTGEIVVKAQSINNTAAGASVVAGRLTVRVSAPRVVD